MEEKRGRRIFITGGQGYLGQELIKRLIKSEDVELIVETDLKNGMGWQKEWNGKKIVHLGLSVLDWGLQKIMEDYQIDTVVHLAWAFNPRRDRRQQWNLDIQGSYTVFMCALYAGVTSYFYAGSSTAYGQFPREERPLKEEEWTNWVGNIFNKDEYQYSIDKAIEDKNCQERLAEFGGKMKIGWMRGAIVLGPDIPLDNVVAHVATAFGPFMFRVKGFNPAMQFVSQLDTANILYRATMERWTGPVNVSGDGVITFKRLIKKLGKIEIALPHWLLKAACKVLWKLHIRDIPPELLLLIMYPWLGDTARLKNVFKHQPVYSTADAVRELAKALKNK